MIHGCFVGTDAAGVFGHTVDGQSYASGIAIEAGAANNQVGTTDLAGRNGLGCVVQACLRRAEADCRTLAAYGVRVRLCKGAYSEPESVAFTARRDVDLSYARCLRVLMNGPGYPMLATHDPRLIEISFQFNNWEGFNTSFYCIFSIKCWCINSKRWRNLCTRHLHEFQN